MTFFQYEDIYNFPQLVFDKALTAEEISGDETEEEEEPEVEKEIEVDQDVRKELEMDDDEEFVEANTDDESDDDDSDEVQDMSEDEVIRFSTLLIFLFIQFSLQS